MGRLGLCTVPAVVARGGLICYIFWAMSQDQLIVLKHAATGEVYWTRKNKKKVARKIELKKYSKALRKHVVFKEAKK